MTYQFPLSDSERLVMKEILENERRELHPEVRRSTMSPATHEALQQRLHMVNELIERLQHSEAMIS